MESIIEGEDKKKTIDKKIGLEVIKKIRGKVGHIYTAEWVGGTVKMNWYYQKEAYMYIPSLLLIEINNY